MCVFHLARTGPIVGESKKEKYEIDQVIEDYIALLWAFARFEKYIYIYTDFLRYGCLYLFL